MDIVELRAQLKEAFDATDADKDGKITAAELKTCLEGAKLEVTDDDVKAIMAEADKDGNGTLEFEEFAEAVVVLGVRVRIVMRLRRLFKKMDTDKTGTLSAENLRQLCDKMNMSKEVSDEEIGEIIKKADKSGDGTVNFEEFVEYLLETQ